MVSQQQKRDTLRQMRQDGTSVVQVRRWNTLKAVKDFFLESGSSQGQNLAVTV
jgi:hypothetical protein